MTTENATASKISKNLILNLDFSDLHSRGVIVVRLPNKVNLDAELSHLSMLWLGDTRGIKKVTCHNGSTKLTLKLTRRRRKFPPMFPILYCASRLMSTKVAIEIGVMFDRRHVNHHIFEEIYASLKEIARDGWKGSEEGRPLSVIDTKLVGESYQIVWTAPAIVEPITD